MTRVSSKGQVVLPGRIREKLGLKSGSRLLVFGEGDTIILKKVGRPTSNTRETLISIRKKIRYLGITRGDLYQEIRAVRARPKSSTLIRVLKRDPPFRMKPVRFKRKIRTSEIDRFLYPAKQLDVH